MTIALEDAQKYAAEALATFTLTLAVSISLLFELPIPTPAIAAIVVALFVYTVGPISGAHINPAVTTGMWAIKQINGRQALSYIAAQVIGAGLAMLSVLAMTASTPVLQVQDTVGVGIAEALGAGILSFGVASVATGKVHQAASGIVVGWSLLIGILVAVSASNGILNPAVAFGLGSVSVMYLAAPLVGGALGAMLYRWMSK